MPPSILYSSARRPTPVQLAQLFIASGIRRPTDDLDRLAKMLAAAHLCITAWNGEELVGITRALSDFAYCCYVSDIAVSRTFQHQGIGRRMIEHLRGQLTEEVTIILIAAPEANGFYEKLGFERSSDAWLIRRKR